MKCQGWTGVGKPDCDKEIVIGIIDADDINRYTHGTDFELDGSVLCREHLIRWFKQRFGIMSIEFKSKEE